MSVNRIHIYWGIGVGIAALLASAGAYYEVTQFQGERTELKQELAYAKVQIDDLADLVQKKEEEVEVHKELLRIFRQQSNDTEYDLSQMRAMVQAATQTVEDIKKLEEADTQLLEKYSKVFFLNEHYVPAQLSYIPNDFVESDHEQQLSSSVLPFLLQMLNAMRGDGLDPKVLSGYRSFGYQSNLKYNHVVTYGTTEANQFVADQGYSEHQLGTTVDIVNGAIGVEMSKFESTGEYQWLLTHAHEYGFILSYPPSNAYYAFEPWHWRFVGKDLATYLHNSSTTFYEMPQRDINEYRIKMFDQ